MTFGLVSEHPTNMIEATINATCRAIIEALGARVEPLDVRPTRVVIVLLATTDTSGTTKGKGRQRSPLLQKKSIVV